MRGLIRFYKSYCVLNGLDDIGLTQKHADKIRDYEQRRIAAQLWLSLSA
jgi:3-isopropylmalate/(R)-2-methylmalate dehydratase small subunit